MKIEYEDDLGMGASDVSRESLQTYSDIMELYEAGLMSAREMASLRVSLNQAFFNQENKSRWSTLAYGNRAIKLPKKTL
jgi:hypothetical protein